MHFKMLHASQTRAKDRGMLVQHNLSKSLNHPWACETWNNWKPSAQGWQATASVEQQRRGCKMNMFLIYQYYFWVKLGQLQSKYTCTMLYTLFLASHITLESEFCWKSTLIATGCWWRNIFRTHWTLGRHRASASKLGPLNFEMRIGTSSQKFNSSPWSFDGLCELEHEKLR